MFHHGYGISELVRSQSIKIDDIRREVAGLRQDVKKALFLLEEIRLRCPNTEHLDIRESEEEPDEGSNL